MMDEGLFEMAHYRIAIENQLWNRHSKFSFSWEVGIKIASVNEKIYELKTKTKIKIASVKICSEI